MNRIVLSKEQAWKIVALFLCFMFFVNAAAVWIFGSRCTNAVKLEKRKNYVCEIERDALKKELKKQTFSAAEYETAYGRPIDMQGIDIE